MRTVNAPFDNIDKLRNSLIQHGPSSNRVYLMKLDPADHPAIVDDLIQLARQNRYGKIFAKVPSWTEEEFRSRAFLREAAVPNYYKGEADALFMSYFTNDDRGRLSDEQRHRIADILAIAQEKASTATENNKDLPFAIRKLGRDDVSDLTRIYGIVFESYPFPIFEREYIIRTMEEDSIAYYGAFDANGRLVAASSAEMDKANSNAEMTDFATIPAARGHGIALHLLRCMEEDMAPRGIHTLYTIARAVSTGMNVTFAKSGYTFSGTLINNTNIAGTIESMNVWYKLRTV